MRVLIADDELISRMVVKRMIKNFCLSVTEIEEAADGEEAVAKAEEMDADIVFLDIEMPGLDGIGAAKKIKEWKNGCMIVFLTAFADFQYAKEAVSIGACEYLVKPVAPEDLKQVIEKCGKKLGLNEKQECSSVEKIRKRGEEEKLEQIATGGLTGRAAMIMMEVKEYIDLHYMEDLAIDLLAEKFGISVNYLNRIFRNGCGMAGKEYLIHIRVEQAKEYLKKPALTIRNVGLMVGYEDPNYCTRIFKKKTGMTPAEFRNQQFFGF